MLFAQGIALSADPNYKVLGSAYPWIAQRLLSDKSPELQETLRALLYKGSKFQFGRLESLLRQAVKAPLRAATVTGSGKRAASPGEQQPLQQDRLTSQAAYPGSINVTGKHRSDCMTLRLTRSALSSGCHRCVMLSTQPPQAATMTGGAAMMHFL